MTKYLFIGLIALFWLNSIFAQTYNDATLAQVRAQDRAIRVNGKLPTLSVNEHAYRGDVYFANRAFPEAREHYDKILKNYPTDPLMAKATFGIGRSFMWERQYELAVSFFDDAVKNFAGVKEGREALAFKGACLVRLGKALDGAKAYEQYTIMFPTGERIDSSYLNVIDAYREAGKFVEANAWVEKTRQRFGGLPAEKNALFARLRMEVFRKNWNDVIKAADDLRLLNDFSSSMTSLSEANFFKAYALEKQGRTNEAAAVYLSIPDTISSYYGSASTDRLHVLSVATPTYQTQISARQNQVRSSAQKAISQFPALYQTELLKYAKSRNVDPRFVLAIMKQESSFKVNAKSPSAARGLLQMTIDTALKYNVRAGFPNLLAEDLYKPNVIISLGSIYISDLKTEFQNLPEAVAASYNGGEDNAARWLKRSASTENAIFTSEIGFAETKDYVFKVMSNYRAYKELYTEDLRRK